MGKPTIGVIGAGRWGKNIIRTLAKMNVLASIAEQDEQSRIELASKYPSVKIYASYNDLLASAVPAVVIATPVISHDIIAEDAILAGKDVFIEKPMSITMAAAIKLEQLAQEKRCILMIGHMLMYRPSVQFIKEFISDGNLGKVYSYSQVRCNLGTIRTQENVLYSLGVHDLAVLDYLVNQPVKSIIAEGQVITTMGVDDDVTLHLSYESGVKAHLHVSWLWPFKERNLTIIGEKGMLRFDELTAEVSLYKCHVNPDKSISNDGAEIVFSFAGEPLALELQHFLDCIISRQTPKSDGAQGVRVVKLLEQASKQLMKQHNTIKEQQVQVNAFGIANA